MTTEATEDKLSKRERKDGELPTARKGVMEGLLGALFELGGRGVAVENVREGGIIERITRRFVIRESVEEKRVRTKLADGTFRVEETTTRTPLSLQAGTEMVEKFAAPREKTRVVYLPRDGAGKVVGDEMPEHVLAWPRVRLGHLTGWYALTKRVASLCEYNDLVERGFVDITPFEKKKE